MGQPFLPYFTYLKICDISDNNERISPKLSGSILAAYPGQLELFSDNTVVHERWRTLATSHGAGFVDVLPAFKAERRQDLYLPADGHTTREANRLMAEAIATALQSILPAR